MLKLININKKYQSIDNDQSGIFDINLVFEDNGLYVIEGKSGCGKSTLLNVLGLLDSFDSGTYYFNNTDISTLDSNMLDAYREKYIGFVFQDYKLFEDLTIKENLNILKGIHLTDEKIDEILKKVDLIQFKDKVVKQLSGGQKQRVSIARAILKESPLILADEPTGNLDSKSSKEIMNLLKEISRNSLVIVVSHDHDLSLEYADHIIEVSDGKIIKNDCILDETTAIKRLENNHSKSFKLSKPVLKVLSSKKIETSLLVIFFALSLTFSSLAFATYDIKLKNLVIDSLSLCNRTEPLAITDNLDNDGNNIYKISKEVGNLEYSIEYKYHYNLLTDDGYYRKDIYLIDDWKLFDLNLISGRMPETYNEVVISDYLFDYYQSPSTIFNNDKLNVVGVYKTIYDTEEYNKLSNNVKEYYEDRYFTRSFIYSIEEFSTVNPHYDGLEIESQIKFCSYLGKDTISQNILEEYDTNKEYTIKYGNLPVNKNELIISYSFYNDYKKYQDIDLLNMEFSLDDLKSHSSEEYQETYCLEYSLTNYKIVGVYDDTGDDSEVFYCNDETFNLCKDIYVKYFTGSFKNSIFISNSYESICNALNNNLYPIYLQSSLTYLFYNTTRTNYRLFAFILVIIFMLLSILVMLKDILSYMNKKKDNIGILMCLGYSKKDIIVHILFKYMLSILISFVISIVGIIVGVIFLNQYIHNYMYVVVPNVLSFPYWGVMVSLFILIAVCFTVTIFALSKLKKNNIIYWLKSIN